MERYGSLYGKDLSSEIQAFLMLGHESFEDGCQKVKFFYEYSAEIAGSLANEYFDVVK